MRASTALALTAAALLAGLGRAQTSDTVAPIGPGSSAPPLAVKTWLKGTPVAAFEPGKTYVVEFWATWCGPCIQSIPHVTKLAQENPDVTFMGIGIWEEEGPQLKAFVDKMGEKMGYNVGYSGNQDGMAVSWMKAAGQNGIPTAFIIKDAQVAWVGHPMSLDQPLAEIKAGTFDAAAFKAKFEEKAEVARVAMARRKELAEIGKDYKAGKRVEAKAALTKLETAAPEMKPQAEAIRFDWLAREDPKAWEKAARTLAASKDDAKFNSLRSFALSHARDKADAPLARRAIELAVAARPDDVQTLNYAAAVYSQTGDDRLALKSTERLLAVLPKSQLSGNAEFKAAMEKMRDDLKAKIASAGTSPAKG